MCIDVFPAHMNMQCICLWCMWRAEKDNRSPRTGVFKVVIGFVGAGTEHGSSANVPNH